MHHIVATKNEVCSILNDKLEPQITFLYSATSQLTGKADTRGPEDPIGHDDIEHAMWSALRTNTNRSTQDPLPADKQVELVQAVTLNNTSIYQRVLMQVRGAVQGVAGRYTSAFNRTTFPQMMSEVTEIDKQPC